MARVAMVLRARERTITHQLTAYPDALRPHVAQILRHHYESDVPRDQDRKHHAHRQARHLDPVLAMPRRRRDWRGEKDGDAGADRSVLRVQGSWHGPPPRVPTREALRPAPAQVRRVQRSRVPPHGHRALWDR